MNGESGCFGRLAALHRAEPRHLILVAQSRRSSRVISGTRAEKGEVRK
jgi:hypothetical protein